jgi:streptomycin 6-kinase
LKPLQLPPEFVRHNEADPDWLRRLPDLLEELATRWSLQIEAHFTELSYNYVAPATRLRNGERCVLKVSRYLSDMRNELAALRLWNGLGAARLIEADASLGAMLVERLDPGTMLVEIAEDDDDAATRIAADVLRQLWLPVVAADTPSGLRSLASWCDAYERNRAVLSRGVEGFPKALFERADALRHELLVSTSEITALHGDLHHYNVLRGRQGEWLAIDPKGLAGDRCFDVCQFFRNPRDRPTVEMNRRRLDILCSELELDRERTRDWCLVHAVLEACWEFEDGRSPQAAIARAKATLRF